eukprot:3721096-Alexandrium_andersonii.AAC.1
MPRRCPAAQLCQPLLSPLRTSIPPWGTTVQSSPAHRCLLPPAPGVCDACIRPGGSHMPDVPA